MKWSDKGQGFLRKNHSGELEGMLRFAPNASTYLAMYVRKKALLSAQVKGTQCTFDDILNPQSTYAFVVRRLCPWPFQISRSRHFLRMLYLQHTTPRGHLNLVPSIRRSADRQTRDKEPR